MKASVFNYWLLSSLPGIIFTVVLIVLLLVFKPWKSKFGNNLGELISEKYYSCGDDSRTDPSGNIPGNYLNLNEYEKNELLRKFVEQKDLNN